jgi:hypothetical protein
MRRRAILSFAAACVLSACAHQQTPSAFGMRDMRWIDVPGDEPKLAFGVPDSDVVVLMMTCAPRSGQVEVAYFAGPDGGGRALELRSGKAVSRLTPDTELPGLESPTNDVVMMATAATVTPALARFAKTGELGVAAGRRATALPAASAGQARRFVESCRA